MKMFHKAHAMCLLLACVTPVWAANPARPLADMIGTLANTLTCATFEDDHSGLGKAVQKRCVTPRRETQATVDRSADKKTLKECIKPGNLIDDDVRQCMKGL